MSAVRQFKSPYPDSEPAADELAQVVNLPGTAGPAPASAGDEPGTDLEVTQPRTRLLAKATSRVRSLVVDERGESVLTDRRPSIAEVWMQYRTCEAHRGEAWPIRVGYVLYGVLFAVPVHVLLAAASALTRYPIYLIVFLLIWRLLVATTPIETAAQWALGLLSFLLT
ncbi:hypothetical protein ACIBKY_51535 [Nonomuraea sp. NPDC050394]|uniref:hypothetical protein n=1 Tax=Nonomuraea sp. NPDC050394 TaxID=3364363 RepID=UPI0037964883